MPTLQQIEDEIERRELIASIQGGATPTEPNPAPTSAAEFMSQLDSVEAKGAPGVGEVATAAVRGLPFANEIGAAAAAIPASFGSGQALGDVYSDILGTEQMKEAEFAEANPEIDALAQGAGELYSLGVAGASAPVRGLSGALAAKGASALNKVKSGVGGLRGARAAAAKPRVTVRGGQMVDDVPKPSRLAATAEGAAVGAILGDDPIEGGLTGAAAINLLFNTPAGRVFTLAMSRKMGGEKFTQAAWHAMNPQNRAKLWELFKSFKKGAK